MTTEEIIKERCNSCGNNVNHTIKNLFRKKESVQIDAFTEIYWIDIYTVLQCNGCESVKIRHEDFFSEDVGEDGEPVVKTRYYPPTIFRKEPQWFNQLNQSWHITKLLKEVYSALQNSSSSLAAMGIRAILEAVMIDKVSDQGSFLKNLQAFEENGYISNIQSQIVKKALEVGHASIHRGFIPNNRQVIFALDLTETLVHHLYLLEDEANKAVLSIPPREK